MELKMQLNGRLLDAIKVHRPSCDNESYLAWLKKELCCKHAQQLCREKAAPLFFLEVSSATIQQKSVKTA